jgi:CBS domain-containing protein
MRIGHVLDARGRQVISVRPETPVKHAVGLFVMHGIGSVPVVDSGGKLIGIFTERDVLYGDFHDCEKFHQRLISDVMTREPITCCADDDVGDIMEAMARQGIGQMPVVRSEELIGVVSLGDIIKSLHEEAATEAKHLTDYIHGPT